MWYQEPDASPKPTGLFEVLQAERDRILKRRLTFGLSAKAYEGDSASSPGDLQLSGLALSGGGIRSATFCLGFLQALNHKDLLTRFDYLSTVSGGGFIGSWWTAWVKRKHDAFHADPAHAGRQCMPAPESVFPPREHVPFTRTAPRIDPLEVPGESTIKPPLSRRTSDPVRHLRRYSNYLTPRRGVASADTWRAIVILAGNQLIALAVLLPFLLAAVVLAQLYFIGRGGPSLNSDYLSPAFASPDTVTRLRWVWEPVVTLIGWALVLLPLRLLRGGVTSARFGLSASFVLLIVCLGGLTYYVVTLHRSQDIPALALAWFVGAFLLILVYGFGPALLEFLGKTRTNSGFLARSEAVIIRFQMRLVGTAAIAGPILLFGAFGHEISAITSRMLPTGARSWYIIIVGILGLAAIGIALRAGLAPQASRRTAKRDQRSVFVIAAAVAVFAIIALIARLSAAGLRALSVAICGASPNATCIPQDIGPFAAAPAMSIPALLVGSTVLIAFAAYEGFTEWNAGATMRGTKPWRILTLLAATVVSVIALIAFRDSDLAPAGFLGAAVAVIAFRMLVVTAADGRTLNWRWSRDANGGLPTGPVTPRRWLTLLACSLLLLFPATGVGLADLAVSDDWNIAIKQNRPTTFVAVLVVVASALAVVYELIWWRKDNWRAVALAVVAAAPSALLVGTFYLLEAGAAATLIGVALSAVTVILALGITIGFIADVNEVSLHGFYRDRLVRAYLGASNPDARRTDTDPTEPYSSDDILLSEALCANAPYPLINATRSLVGGRDLETAQRGGEAFLLSPLYCGSSSLQFRPTNYYMGGHITLGTAMAVSGAAASPTMASKTKSASAAMLMTLANVRLGYWAAAPNGSRWHMLRPRLWPFYVLREFFASTASGSPYVYLTDGGHFDNTGLYPLICRGCTKIVVVDCGADPDGFCSDMGDVVRRCRIDFGAEISFPSSPNVATGYPVAPLPRFVVGTVVYHPTHAAWLRGVESKRRGRPLVGKVIWVKPSVSAEDTPDVLQYARENPIFPQESTVNQWYGETQFESYRQLGYLVGSALAKEMMSVSPPLEARETGEMPSFMP